MRRAVASRGDGGVEGVVDVSGDGLGLVGGQRAWIVVRHRFADQLGQLGDGEIAFEPVFMFLSSLAVGAVAAGAFGREDLVAGQVGVGGGGLAAGRRSGSPPGRRNSQRGAAKGKTCGA